MPTEKSPFQSLIILRHINSTATTKVSFQSSALPPPLSTLNTSIMFSSLVRSLVRRRSAVAPIASPLRQFSALSTTDALSPKVEDRESILEVFDDPSVRAELNKLREIESDLKNTLDAETAPIDWEHWAKQITYPHLVDEIKEIYESTPDPDIEHHMEIAKKKVNEIFDPMIAEYEALAKESESGTAELEKKLEEVTFLKNNFRNLSVEEFLEKYPAFRKSIEEDIKNNRWFVDS